MNMPSLERIDGIMRSVSWDSTTHTLSIDGELVSHYQAPCPGSDPACPGQDGEWCHYLGPDPMQVGVPA